MRDPSSPRPIFSVGKNGNGPAEQAGPFLSWKVPMKNIRPRTLPQITARSDQQYRPNSKSTGPRPVLFPELSICCPHRAATEHEHDTDRQHIGAMKAKAMKRDDVICPGCGAGFRRIELSSRRGIKGEYRCPVCDTLLQTLDGKHLVEYRLTIQPSIKALND
jgi:hypothetical protein